MNYAGSQRSVLRRDRAFRCFSPLHSLLPLLLLSCNAGYNRIITKNASPLARGVFVTLRRRSAPWQTIVADDTFGRPGRLHPSLCHGDGESSAAMTPPALAVVRRGSKSARFWAHPNLEEQVPRLGRAFTFGACRRRPDAVRGVTSSSPPNHQRPPWSRPAIPRKEAARCAGIAGAFHHLPQIVPAVVCER